MEFWHNTITQKSFEVLKKIKAEYDFVLIGGWAIYLYSHSLKSKDIDIAIDFEQLEKIKEDFGIIKNERLKKYECKIDEIDIDIYVDFYSNPGLPAEEIHKYTNSIEGFKIPKPEILLILKQKAFSERSASLKGQKDKIDIISLLNSVEFDFAWYMKLLKEYNQENYKADLINILKRTHEVPELNLNKNTFAKFKRKLLKLLIAGRR